MAAEAHCIGPAKVADSYLKIDRVISAAEIGNVQAIHPGYGFLAENAHVADVCRDCKIEFIGPTHEAMALVGDKNAARHLARQIGVPTGPGSEGLGRRRARPSAAATSTWSDTWSIPATWKCRCWPTSAAMWYTFGSATARCSVATRSWSKKAPRRSWKPTRGRRGAGRAAGR